MTTQRRITHFTSLDGLLTYTFPDANAEQQIEQDYRTQLSPVAGADYAFDHRGARPSEKLPRVIAIRAEYWEDTATLLEAEADAAHAAIGNIGLGWLYRVDADDSTYRRCLARPVAAPSVVITLDGFFGHSPVEFRFVGLSDWLDPSETVVTHTVTTVTADVVVTNPGSATTTWVEIRVRANDASGFNHPQIANLTNGYQVDVVRNSISADSEVRIDSELGTVEVSEDNGTTYSDAFGLATLGETQVAIFALDPGANSIHIAFDAVPNCDVTFTFAGADH